MELIDYLFIEHAIKAICSSCRSVAKINMGSS